MTSLWERDAAETLLARIARLEPGSRARWGRMTCPQMVVHVTDAFALYTGELRCTDKRTPVQYPPLKQAFIYLLPIPRHVPTAPELKSRVPGAWDEEVARLRDAVRRFASQRARTDWPRHPLFGRVSRRGWGVLAWKHTDHHLRQFGV